LQTIQFRYGKAGLSVAQEPIPWNAEAVWVEARIQFPPAEDMSRGDWELRQYGFPPVMAERLDRQPDQTWGIAFRLPPPQQATSLVLRWRGQVLARVIVPFLSADEFLRNLRLESPTFLALLGNRYVPCRALVQSQCGGLLAGGILSSPTSLLPLLDLNLVLEWTDARGSSTRQVALVLTSEQLKSCRALVSASLGDDLEQVSGGAVQWIAAGRRLAGLPVRMVSRQTFEGSVYLIDSRFVYDHLNGGREFSSYLPGQDGITRLGPCFRLASRIPGVAGLCHLQVWTQPALPAQPPSVQEHEVLVTDGPAPFIPFTWEANDFRQLASVELCRQGQLLGSLPVFCTPVAKFCGEGGFADAPAFDWSAIAEHEMNGRLSKLMAAPDEGVASLLTGQL
jgi:hypothetical protein